MYNKLATTITKESDPVRQTHYTAIGGLHQTVLQSKTDAMRSERTKLIQL